MKRWALLFVRKDGVPTFPVFEEFDLTQEHVEELRCFLNNDHETTAKGLYYAVEIEDE